MGDKKKHYKESGEYDQHEKHEKKKDKTEVEFEKDGFNVKINIYNTSTNANDGSTAAGDVAAQQGGEAAGRDQASRGAELENTKAGDDLAQKGAELESQKLVMTWHRKAVKSTKAKMSHTEAVKLRKTNDRRCCDSRLGTLVP